MTDAAQTAELNVPATRLGKLLVWLERYRWGLAVLTFAGGLASFLLIHRTEALARWLGAFLLLSWLWMLVEGLFGRYLEKRGGLTEFLSRFATQAIHQETFFFTLPFFIATTTWSTGQAVFTGGLIVAAAASLLDPLYFGWVAKRRALYLAFHALAIFIAMLTALPLIWQLTTAQSMALSSIAMGVLALPSLARVIGVHEIWRWLLMALLAVSMAFGAWMLRGWIPPATLWVTSGTVTQQMDERDRLPGAPLQTVAAASLNQRGLYAYSAIRAPRGLHEEIAHVWYRNGVVVDRIPLSIAGGRGEGYRAWSHKLNFPAESVGEWRIEVITAAGQLIGVIRFQVTGAASVVPEVIEASEPIEQDESPETNAPAIADPPKETEPMDETDTNEPAESTEPAGRAPSSQPDEPGGASGPAAEDEVIPPTSP